MKIALDYDETFTADPGLWRPFVRNALERGHAVAFVTFRYEGHGGNEDILADANLLGIPVVFCNGRQKSHCYQADIWIDDMPVLIPSYGVMTMMTRGCEAMGDTP